MLSNIETGLKQKYNPEEQNIRGKRVVIVGDADGIGRATAAQLVERGAKVFFGVQTARELSMAFATIARTGGEWDGAVADLSQPEAIKQFFQNAERRLGRIDVLINALYGENTPIIAGDPAVCANLCVQEAIRRMQVGGNKYAGRGQILNVGSTRMGASISPLLRHEASELGIRLTQVDVPNAAGYSAAAEEDSSEAVARCVVQSMAQPFAVDLVFLDGKFQGPIL